MNSFREIDGEILPDYSGINAPVFDETNDGRAQDDLLEDSILVPVEVLLGEPEEVSREWQELRARARVRGALAVETTLAEKNANEKRAIQKHRKVVPKQIYTRS